MNTPDILGAWTCVVVYCCRGRAPFGPFKLGGGIAKEKCISCGKCKRVCPMNVDVIDNSRKRENGKECILCMECVKRCPKGAL